ncbi:MAG TPA: PAS domain S-box protein [Syntrophales bacterium]|nr:PAS domain S-box protein [Syntrophobacterales bacterium]HNQ00792.1 PAS domain S-box protein [Syntrophales bacterium]HQL90074.1 PAS domain S-box protein [Syntrophales bacterium]
MSKRGVKRNGPSVPISFEERYDSLFENAGEGIFQTSVSGRILNVNPALARLFGYRSPEEMKRNIRATYRQIYADRSLREKILRRVEAEGHAKFEFRFLRKDKSQGWGYVSMHAVRNAAGKTAYYEGFFVDMTAHKELEEQLQASRDLLEQRVVERTRKIAELNRELAADIAQRKKAEKELRTREKELQRRAVKLEAFNITLRTLLEQREADRKEIERCILANIDDLIMPGVERLKGTALTKQAQAHIQHLQENLRALTSPFLIRIKENAHLTARELQIADYIKKGKSSKQIGSLMRLSPGTVDFHRNRIRRKLNLRGKKVSLQEYLANQF